MPDFDGDDRRQRAERNPDKSNGRFGFPECSGSPAASSVNSCLLLADFVAEVGDDDGAGAARTRLLMLWFAVGAAGLEQRGQGVPLGISLIGKLAARGHAPATVRR